MQFSSIKNKKNIYFIGIGGISMSALAKLLAVWGYSVSGSDAMKGEQTDSLAFYGVRVHIGEDGMREDLLCADIVVYTDAVLPENKEFASAKHAGKAMFSRGEFLGVICGDFSNVIAVSGSHGKTTCTSMCAHVLTACKVPFSAHIGGEDSKMGNFYFSGREYMITEACEYKKNLLHISSDVSIVLNIDKDHMECYQSEGELVKTFQDFSKKSKTCFVCADDDNCKKISDCATFGMKNALADYRATEIRVNDERYAFTVEEYGRAVARVRLKSIGFCNVYNALAAFAAMRSLGFHENEIAEGLEEFISVKRRFERIGCYRGASFICDYAHHPREIKATLKTINGICRGNLYVVFQPHTYSRTKLLMSDFIEVLRPIKNLMIYKTYPAREKYDEMGAAKTLSNIIGDCLYAENIYVLKTWLKTTLKSGDAVLFLGAGDIYYVAQHVLKDLGR